jgi:cyclic 2,3-diphosphoglycerate synthetase
LHRAPRVKISAIVLIDGEHYPAVVADALAEGAKRYEFRAALFLGGAEKIERAGLRERAEELYGLPVMFADDWAKGLEAAIEKYQPEVVVDLSDEPVLGYVERFRLASIALAREVGYEGPDFHFSPASSERLCATPSLAIIGTGKRVGKTALSGFVARVLQAAIPVPEGRPSVVVVAMGRGGPARPEVVDGTRQHLRAEDLLAWSRQGRHAASDYFEDAALSGVVTVGCRRCGGGMAGQPFASNVVEGVGLANSLKPGLLVLEGSGAAQPPVACDARLLVAGAHQAVDDIAGYLGAYRLLISDAVVLTMAEEPLASREKVQAVREAVEKVRPGMQLLPVVFRPRPVESIEGRKVACFSTAPEEQKEVLRGHLERRWGCKVELFSTHLADRDALRADLENEAMDRVDTVVTEIKAAAIDVVAEKAAERGLPVVFLDNVPVEVSPEGVLREESRALEDMALELAALAKERFEQRS